MAWACAVFWDTGRSRHGYRLPGRPRQRWSSWSNENWTPRRDPVRRCFSFFYLPRALLAGPTRSSPLLFGIVLRVRVRIFWHILC